MRRLSSASANRHSVRMALDLSLERDDDNGVYSLRFGPGAFSAQTVEVCLDETQDTGADMLLDFDSEGRLVQIEFLNIKNLPLGALGASG